MLRDALRTDSQQFDDRPLGAEPDRIAGRLQALGHTGVFDLGDLAAVTTNQELAGVRVIRMCTAHIDMQALELVHQTLFEQEIQ